MHIDLVSIIVPIYNSEKYLDSCIKSIRNQTYKNIEIILIDDGSNDNSYNICKNHAEEDNRIIVLHKKNGGVSSARNLGLNKVTGKYTIFVDSDDFVEKNMIEELISIQNKYNVDIVIFGFYINNLINQKVTSIYLNEETIYSKEDIYKVLPRLIKNEQINSPCNKFYKTYIIKENKILFDETTNIGEDLLFNFQLFNNLESLHISQKCFYHYMVRENESLTRNFNPNKYKMLKYVNEKMKEEQVISDEVPELIEAIKFIRVKNIFSCLLDLFNKNNSLSYFEKRQFIKDVLCEEESQNYHHCNNKLYMILIFVLRTKNINLIYSFTYLIYKIRDRK